MPQNVFLKYDDEDDDERLLEDIAAFRPRINLEFEEKKVGRYAENRYGLEVEYFVASKSNKSILHAKSVIPYTDGNCSIGELGTPVTSYWRELPSLVRKGLASHVTTMVNNFGWLLSDIQIILAPFTFIVSPNDVMYFKTCGIHWNQSGNTLSYDSRALSHDLFIRYVRPHLGFLQLARFRAPVIGPSSGRVYTYNEKTRIWNDKSEQFNAVNLWEYRPLPCGGWVLMDEAMELAWNMINMPNKFTEKMGKDFADMLNQVTVIDATELLNPSTGVARLIRYGGELPLLSTPRNIELQRALIPRTDALLYDGKITTDEKMFFSFSERGRRTRRSDLVFIKEREVDGFLDALHNKDDITKYIPWENMVFVHKFPRVESWQESGALLIEVYREQMTKKRAERMARVAVGNGRDIAYYRDDENNVCNCPKCRKARGEV